MEMQPTQLVSYQWEEGADLKPVLQYVRQPEFMTLPYPCPGADAPRASLAPAAGPQGPEAKPVGLIQYIYDTPSFPENFELLEDFKFDLSVPNPYLDQRQEPTVFDGAGFPIQTPKVEPTNTSGYSSSSKDVFNTELTAAPAYPTCASSPGSSDDGYHSAYLAITPVNTPAPSPGPAASPPLAEAPCEAPLDPVAAALRAASIHEDLVYEDPSTHGVIIVQAAPSAPNALDSKPKSKSKKSMSKENRPPQEPQLSGDGLPKPSESCLGLVARAIMAAGDRGMQLNEIYKWIMDTFPYYKSCPTPWRNNVRYNLSSNECFVKGPRSKNGRGFVWTVHASCLEAFEKGDFDRSRARLHVRRCNRAQGLIETVSAEAPSKGMTAQRVSAAEVAYDVKPSLNVQGHVHNMALMETQSHVINVAPLEPGMEYQRQMAYDMSGYGYHNGYYPVHAPAMHPYYGYPGMHY